MNNQLETNTDENKLANDLSSVRQLSKEPKNKVIIERAYAVAKRLHEIAINEEPTPPVRSQMRKMVNRTLATRWYDNN
ncbi:unnamed protein product [Rotaria sp. Silwood1]|nr:unnamed protein product [Rotaria sp. Silwood1]